MSNYRPYPKYKPSGVEWLGEVPEGWVVMKLSFVSYLRSGESITSTDIEEAGTYPVFGGNGHRGFTENYTHDGNFVLVGRQGALCGNVHFTSGKFWASEHALVANPLRKYSTRWFGEMLRAMNLGQYSVSAAQPGLSVENIGNLRLPSPPLPEQHQIATFLDRECGKLDALQAKQERLFELLKEKRQALISHAVTKGLDPNAKLKPSGIEWLGEVPEHWAVRKLGLIGDFKGGAGFPDDHQGETENEIPFFKVGDIVNSDEMGVMRQANHTITRATARILRAFIFPEGTIVFTKVGAALLLKRFRSLGQPSCIDNNMMGMATGKDAQSDFLLYVLPLLDFSLFVNPGAVPSVNEGQISSQRIPLPPLVEQRAIVAHLDEKCGKIDRLMAKAERAIALLKERRSALISAAVTGKIDVR